MNNASLNKWNTTIKNFETAVEDFNKIASQNLDENEKKLQDIQAVVKRELENLEKFNSYAEVKYQELSSPKCFDPTPLVIKQIGCILTVDMLIRVMSVASLAFFGDSLTVVIIGFVTYTIAEVIGVFGNILSFKYEMEASDIQFTNRIYHEKLEDFKQFDRVLEDFLNFQKFIAVTKFSMQNETKKNSLKSSSEDSLNYSTKDEHAEEKKSGLQLQKSSSNSDIQKTDLDNSTITIIEEDANNNFSNKFENRKNESSDTSSSDDSNEISIDLSVPLINKKIAKCLKSYQKLPERFHSDETESYLFSNMVQKYPKNDSLLINLENITESDEVKIVNNIDFQNVHNYIHKSNSSNLIQNFKYEQGNQENEQNGNNSRKNSNQLIQASREQINYLSNEFKERFKVKKLPAFIKLPTGSIISLT